jgi:hypothetical protein
LGDRADLSEHLATWFGEAEGIEAAVFWVGLAGEEFAGLKRVDDGDETAGVHAESLGELLLADAGPVAQQTEDAGLSGRELKRLEEAGELLG